MEQKAKVGVGPLLYMALGQLARPLARLLGQFLVVAAVLVVRLRKPYTLAVQEAVVKWVLVHVPPMVLFPVVFSLPHPLLAGPWVAPVAVVVVAALAAKALAGLPVARVPVRLDRPSVVKQLQRPSAVPKAPRA